jgi:hypothetical protein
MKDELTINDLAIYLPYGLKVKVNDTKTIFKLGGITSKYDIQSIEGYEWHITTIKPILYPLSHANGYFKNLEHIPEIDHIMSDDIWLPFNVRNVRHKDIPYLPFCIIQLFAKHHFDIFGLIGRGLAVDKLTITP